MMLFKAVVHARPLKALYSIPYYFRANRGGKGQMRVGLHKVDRKVDIL